MEKIYRNGFGCCLISHKSFQTHRIINCSSSVSSVRFDSFAPAFLAPEGLPLGVYRAAALTA
jgi:hypothetical protein